MPKHTVLVLGGYGFFGARIAQALAADPAISLLIGGRNRAKAEATARANGLAAHQGFVLDAQAPDLAAALRARAVQTVIHTAGPFQGQDYAVARAAISAGANYIDLADGREFVANISQLNEIAKEKGVLVTSGASSLPALSSAVVDRYRERFSRLDSIQHAIASGARAPGLATMRGVFSYCGKPFKRWENGQWQVTHGWLDLHRYRYPAPVHTRLLGSCDVPDLVLFPQRYPGVKTVKFHAGFASALGHLVVWGGALLVRLNCLTSLVPMVRPLNTISRWIEPLISDKGAMFVSMQGVDHDGRPLELVWHLIATHNHGPHIPCGAAIALARKLAHGPSLPHGAMPCMGLLNVEEYLAALEGFSVQELPP